VKIESVILESGLEVATTAVTRRQWIEVMGRGTEPQRLWEAEGWANQSLDCPATHVSALDAEEFCRRLGDGWRLPTVDEQAEYCYPLPADFPLEDHAVYDQPYGDGPSPVASKESMANGLYDTHGLVYEWAVEEVSK
jgi:formylglycine-generating enzyme required for sulfatase activity